MAVQDALDLILSGKPIPVELQGAVSEAFVRQQDRAMDDIDAWAANMAADITEWGMIYDASMPDDSGPSGPMKPAKTE